MMGSNPRSVVLEFNYSTDDVYFYCRYNWMKGKYVYNSCERISYDHGLTQHFVKENEKENVSKEVEQIIVNEKFAF